MFICLFNYVAAAQNLYIQRSYRLSSALEMAPPIWSSSNIQWKAASPAGVCSVPVIAVNIFSVTKKYINNG